MCNVLYIYKTFIKINKNNKDIFEKINYFKNDICINDIIKNNSHIFIFIIQNFNKLLIFGFYFINDQSMKYYLCII